MPSHSWPRASIPLWVVVARWALQEVCMLLTPQINDRTIVKIGKKENSFYICAIFWIRQSTCIHTICKDYWDVKTPQKSVYVILCNASFAKRLFFFRIREVINEIRQYSKPTACVWGELALWARAVSHLIWEESIYIEVCAAAKGVRFNQK